MKKLHLIGISLLVIVWWVGVWGCIETMVHGYAKTPHHAFCIYFSLIAFVLAIFVFNPSLFDKVIEQS
jgi:hypothetical protein